MKIIDFHVPADWHELDDKQLRYVYHLLAADYSADELKLLCLLRWSGAKVVGRQDGGGYLLKLRKTLFEVSAVQLAEVLSYLDWLVGLPKPPVRPAKIKRHQAVAANFQGVAFATFVAADNLLQGYLATKNDALLDELAAVVYPGLGGPLSTEDRIAVFYWIASLKDYFAHRYSDFFQPTSADSGNLLGSGPSNVEDAMNAQIRALTKGDVTKENEILALDTWRALTELNAQAREYRDFNTRYGTKS